jgi:hypothetical protein
MEYSGLEFGLFWRCFVRKNRGKLVFDTAIFRSYGLY